MSALSVEEWNVSVVFEAVLWGAFIEQTRGCTVPSQGKGSCWFGIRAVQGWQWPRAVSPENIRVCSARPHPDEHSDHRGASGEKGDLDLDQSEPSAAAAGGTGAAPLERGFELWHQEGGKLSRKGGRMSQVYRQLAQASAGGKQVRPLQAEEAVGRTRRWDGPWLWRHDHQALRRRWGAGGRRSLAQDRTAGIAPSGQALGEGD